MHEIECLKFDTIMKFKKIKVTKQKTSKCIKSKKRQLEEQFSFAY